MLTKDLLQVTKYRPNIDPVYREPNEYANLAAAVIDAYEPGRSRGAIEEAVAELETHDTFKLVRGLAKLLDRRSTFERRSPIAPPRLREAAFRRGYVTTEAEREAAIAAVADRFDLAVEEVEAGLWADREENEVLVEAPEVPPADLLRAYNLSLTQTLLFDAVELECTVSDNFQELFGRIGGLGLMYTVDPDLAVTVTGPAALFDRTRKYGTALAKLVPSIMRATEWQLAAQVETEVGGERRIYEFSVGVDRAHLFPQSSSTESYDSEVERDFATRIGALAEGWAITREPTILRANDRVMIPDFGFERDGHEFYLEIVGFWTPEYLREKIEKVRAIEHETPLVLAVDESLNCTAEDFAGAEQVFFYDGKIPVKPVIQRLKRIEERIVDADLETIDRQGLDLPESEPTDIQTVAEAADVAQAAVTRYLETDRPGLVSNGTYLPPAVIDELRNEIDRLDGSSLAAVNPVLESYGVGQAILEELGYTIRYTSLAQDEATIETA